MHGIHIIIVRENLNCDSQFVSSAAGLPGLPGIAIAKQVYDRIPAARVYKRSAFGTTN